MYLAVLFLFIIFRQMVLFQLNWNRHFIAVMQLDARQNGRQERRKIIRL
jgi:hypothetical protein